MKTDEISQNISISYPVGDVIANAVDSWYAAEGRHGHAEISSAQLVTIRRAMERRIAEAIRQDGADEWIALVAEDEVNSAMEADDDIEVGLYAYA